MSRTMYLLNYQLFLWCALLPYKISASTCARRSSLHGGQNVTVRAHSAREGYYTTKLMIQGTLPPRSFPPISPPSPVRL